MHNEFERYNGVIEKLSKQLYTAARSVSEFGVRTRAMTTRLRDVEKLPDDIAQILLGSTVAERYEVYPGHKVAIAK